MARVAEDAEIWEEAVGSPPPSEPVRMDLGQGNPNLDPYVCRSEPRAPLDAAMGRAGGNSRGGQGIDVFPDTAALIEELGGVAGTPAPEPSGGFGR